ncbi:MAG TPA: S8 family serine peptidase [Thermoanaerobaculia bacterium]|nr:S8 family serine peptidase [Thermoanaerobaculia bacterium]
MKRLAALLLLALPLAAAPRKVIVEYAERPRFERVRVHREFTRAFRGAAIEVASDADVERVKRLPGVIAVYPDTEVHAHAAGGSAAPLGRRPAIHASGDGITVAVIDTGIDYTHPALAGKVVGGWDFVNNDADAMDDFRHGTHVAGIIAAQSAEVTGVAPGVKLLAYKVLNARGSGVTSDVIAAIERAMDPNNDGDTSDHADVINLSLGSAGHADDPGSRAVNRAVALGIVVVVSAGNEGEFHRVGSPGVAESAITVGAIRSDNTIAEFSSRGPAAGSGAIKPDLVAPGVSITSTIPGGLYMPLSGTSMAAPYVAGLAALLLEAHPDWTPARVKSALVNSANAIAVEEMMTQGSGAVVRDRVFASDLFVAPTQLNFGLDAVTSSSWTTTRTLTMRNESNAPRTIAARAEGTPTGVTIAVDAFTLAAGETRDVVVTISADNTALGKPLTRSLSFGGALVFEWAGGSARVPWAFIRAGRATVTYAGATPDVLWNVPDSRYGSSVPIGPNGMETLIEPGTYELAVVAAKEGEAVRVIVAEEQKIEGDVMLAFTDADAPHEVLLDAMPERATAPGKLYTMRARLAGPGGSLLLPMQSRTIHTSSFSSRYALLLTEAFVDTTVNTIQIAQHEPLRGVSGDVTMRIAPSAYASQEVRIAMPAEVTGRRQIQIMPRDYPRGSDFGPAPESILVSTDGDEWRGTLTMTAEAHENYASGVQLAVRGAFDSFARPSLITPMLRRNANGFFATRTFDAPATPVYAQAGEPLEFGRGPSFLKAQLEVTGTAMIGSLDHYGVRNETRRANFEYEVFDVATGQALAGGMAESAQTFLPLPRPGKLRVELKGEDSTTTVQFDTTTGTATPPAITSVAIVDGSGRHATTLPRNGNGALIFSAVDAVTAGAFFRRAGTNTWVQLTPVATGTDAILGTIYRIDLADALRMPEGAIEISIDTRDDAGSWTSWQATAFTVDTESPKRRAVRK